ncbi:Putative carbonic anhydrase-like protein 2 [Caenorhabditis elegans]|uniref:Putative carbonic anhydrase-like protein 2 n=1 Tax=Caenorhabditis elegans TaxID=6239 RepID=CAH2_CAEEL|nr:Putative carbonic anhydrase-like protein 2 [Caenorhabditis elegans]Q18932.3 RecName: Full=Putative carbonic anhydrase-like protein 2; Flags: Precursor [Caenorhabditis elegans]CCD68342.1 Putative carbonic anhydrase-like protein 2 [Caenorhabditis elegans]|eukprot:NP_495567.3 Putative carbonic anhydrase-like protein 2 [Caenorhabditis elegans]
MIPWLLTACIYPCVIGPDFWGLLHGDWRMCTAGQMQSPVNIDPSQLLYDPHLMPINIEGNIVEAVFENTGQLPVVTVKDLPNRPTINITGGPTMPYRYKLHQISVHFGRADEGEKGSEHTVDRVRFPAEIQLLAYNSALYPNFSVAMTSPRGLLAVSVIVDIGKTTSVELRRLTVASQSINYKGQTTNLTDFQPSALLPKTSHYVTYEGSLTFPGCHETVTWVILNNPIYITNDDLQIWNEMQKTETKQPEPSYMTPAYRPLKSLNGRLVRTNINVGSKQSTVSSSCPSNVYVEMGYQANPGRNKRNDSVSRRYVPTSEVFEIDSIRPDDVSKAGSF